MKDFDGDGVFDADDNCPVAPNPDQANCNADAEDAKQYPRRGDACDPIPCADASTRELVTTVLSQSGGGSGFTQTTRKWIVDQIDVKPLASSFYGDGAGYGRLRGPVLVGSATTKYRFCQPNTNVGLFCDENSVDDDFVNSVEGAPSPARPYHKARLVANPWTGPGQDNEPLVYAPAAPAAARRWKYVDDYNLWLGQGWITDSGWNSFFSGDHYTGLNGRFWSHAATTKGRFTDPLDAPLLTASGDVGPDNTGYRINNAGVASSASNANGSDLANHYIPLQPDGEVTQTWAPPNDMVTYLPWWCDIGTKLQTVVGERAPLISIGASYGVMQHDGTAVVIDSSLTTSARSAMASTQRWAAAAEVMREQGKGGFQAVTFSANGTQLSNVVGITTNNLLGTGADLGFSVSTTTGPGARSDFTAVYSRVDDLAFVVGGTVSGGGQAGDIWMRQVRGSLGWANITPAGLSLQKVLAATYSFRDGKLWVLDEHVTANTRRLIRISPLLGHAEVVYTFTKSSAFTKQWLVLDVDGNVVLASSGSSNFGIARFQTAGMHPALIPTVSKLETRAGQLMAAPVIDSKGNTIVTRAQSGVPLVTERRTSLQGTSSTLAALDAIL